MTNLTQETRQQTSISFSDIETAFASKTDKELRFSYFIFRMMQNGLFVSLSSSLSLLALKLYLPVIPIIKATVFRQFCGGSNLEECSKVIEKLGKSGIGAILDFAVEGSTKEKDFEDTKNEIIRVIRFSKQNPDIPFACLKPSGIASQLLLEKMSSGKPVGEKEKADFEKIRKRLDEICSTAYQLDMPIYIDSEETWVQPAIDLLAEEMMRKYNGKKAIVATTLQMYRHDRLEYLTKLIEAGKKEGFVVGVKIVRGAYMEKENKRAKKMGYPTPINPTKEKTDHDYNEAMKLLVANLDYVELCAGTHNEESSMVVVNEMKKRNIPNNHPRIWFSQLFGMSDHISYNLAAAGCNVTKYLPYGPVRSTIPYLVRRAQENSAIAGQMGKEYKLIVKEIQRRKSKT